MKPETNNSIIENTNRSMIDKDKIKTLEDVILIFKNMTMFVEKNTTEYDNLKHLLK